MSRFLEALNSGRVMLMDGAMGTELQRAGIHQNECYELWNLTQPDRVQAIHQAYRQSGAQCFLTNTFQANPVALAKHGLEKQLEDIHHAGVALAKAVSSPNDFVILDIGPPSRELVHDKPRMNEWQQAVLRASSGAAGMLFETYSAWMVSYAVKEMRTLMRGDQTFPVLLSMAYKRVTDDYFLTDDSFDPETIAGAARKDGVVALGVNCGLDIDMKAVIKILHRYREHTDLPLFARPNAGTPRRIGSRWVYPHTPEQMAARLPELLEAGICMVGGCCGTTPDHIAAFRPIIDDWNKRHAPKGGAAGEVQG